MKKLFFSVLACAVATTAHADRWLAICPTAYKEHTFVNLSTLKDSGNVRTFQLAYVNVDPDKKYDLAMLNAQINCKKQIIKTVDVSSYLKGKKTDSIKLPNKWGKIVPDSMSATLYVSLCGPLDEDLTFTINGGLKAFTEAAQGLIRRFM